jgi:hypothetical protein
MLADLGLGLYELAPGVRGYVVEDDGVIYIPMVVSTEPGKGNVGSFLDALPKQRTIKFPNVISARLEGMLTRRGYVLTEEWSEEFQEVVEVYMRERRG